MKRTIIVVSLLLTSTVVSAATFASREAAAKHARSTPVGAQYDAALGPHIGTAMRACVPPGSSASANLGSFALIAYVTPAGTLVSVAVEPRTKVSSCFAKYFAKSVLSKPPATSLSSGYPISVEMRVTQ